MGTEAYRTPQEIELAGRQKLSVERREGEDVIRLHSPDGGVELSILVREGGTTLRFEGDLSIEASHRLAFQAERVEIRGREGVAIASGGDLEVEAARDLHSRASIQNITASQGNLNLRANDFVRLKGEIIKLNC
jgi:hypothetical protein